MGYYVYRYTDKTDGIIKYVGIVYGKTRELAQRINEHKKDNWHKNGDWQIDYFSDLLSSRADCEIWESHLIAKYETFKWYNKAKKDWGMCQYLEATTPKWVEFSQEKNIKPKIKTKPKIKEININHTDENLTLRYAFGSICKHTFTSKQIDEIIGLISSFPTPLIYTHDSPDNLNSKFKWLKHVYNIYLAESGDSFDFFKYVLLKDMVYNMATDIIKDNYVLIIYFSSRLLSCYQPKCCWKPIDLPKEYQICDEDVRLNLSHEKLKYAFDMINNYTELFIDFNLDNDMSFKVNQKTYHQIVDTLQNLKEKTYSF